MLRAMDPSREYAALVQVTLTPDAKLDGLQNTGAEFDYMPGTLRQRSEAMRARRLSVLGALPQKRNVLVLLPNDGDNDLEKNAATWIRRGLGMSESEPVDFQWQIDPRKAATPGSPGAAGEAPFYGSKWFWISVIIAGTFIAGLILILLLRNGRRRKGKGKAKDAKGENPLQTFMHQFKNEKDEPAAEAEEETEEGELPAAVRAQLAAVERICLHDLEVASMAFGNLASRPEQLTLTALAVQALGLDRALHLFPKANGATWAQVGDAIAANTDADQISLEDATAFRRFFSGEVARLQRSKEQVKLLPQLEALDGVEIARRLRGYGPAKGAMALAVLSENAIAGVVPKMTGQEVLTYLGALMSTSAVRMSDLEQIDRGDTSGSPQDQVIELESIRKVAIVLSTLPAAEEFAAFDKLAAARGDRLYGEIAPFRLYPMHLHYVSPQAIADALASRELDDLRKIVAAAPTNLHAKLLAAMSPRQRAIVEQGGGETSEHDAEALRAFLAEVHTRNFLGQPLKLTETFGSRKVA